MSRGDKKNNGYTGSKVRPRERNIKMSCHWRRKGDLCLLNGYSVSESMLESYKFYFP